MRNTARGAARLQRGFSLVAAVFIIVVLALLGTTMVFLGVLERETVSAAIQGSRAYHAARSGVEAGLFLAVSSSGPGFCGDSNYNLNNIDGLNGFNVAVNCSAATHRELATNYSVYVITSTATTGTFGTPDYYERVLRITATNASSP